MLSCLSYIYFFLKLERQLFLPLQLVTGGARKAIFCDFHSERVQPDSMFVHPYNCWDAGPEIHTNVWPQTFSGRKRKPFKKSCNLCAPLRSQLRVRSVGAGLCLSCSSLKPPVGHSGQEAPASNGPLVQIPAKF